MANFTLTAGADTVVGGPADDTVETTGDWTLNAGDSLIGGAGTDTLAIYAGAGAFRVDRLATFTGFESITITNNITSFGGPAVFLGSQSIAVTGYGAGSKFVSLGSGAVTLQGINTIESASASNWNAGNSIDGGNIGLGSNGAVYDLTMNKLSHINSLYGRGNDLTVEVNSAVAAGVASFNSHGTNTKLVTSDAALDLSHSTVSGFTVASGNASGTNFTVSDIGTALQIAGGSGSDTVTAQSFTFSADQRNAIFGTASVERIVDASGTYTAPQNPKLTAGSDTVTGTVGNDTVNGTAATLNAGDSLIGGAGTDTLALYGGGTFQVDQLASFTGFESITITNYDSPAAVYLGSQSIAVTGYGAGDKQVYLGSGAVTF
jgi:RTX calcium-binding nonapeptide repeat (4 copies)